MSIRLSRELFFGPDWITTLLEAAVDQLPVRVGRPGVPTLLQGKGLWLMQYITILRNSNFLAQILNMTISDLVISSNIYLMNLQEALKPSRLSLITKLRFV